MVELMRCMSLNQFLHVLDLVRVEYASNMLSTNAIIFLNWDFEIFSLFNEYWYNMLLIDGFHYQLLKLSC